MKKGRKKNEKENGWENGEMRDFPTEPTILVLSKFYMSNVDSSFNESNYKEIRNFEFLHVVFFFFFFFKETFVLDFFLIFIF